ncbi:protein ACCELERATED CELL DEATH 6 [Melia azedarach]|uniref:Protein ACCELERATED CELL DEATH 6 n=1 Tax=Melia azedarach TaxID=155640 RepID=A0ACC1Y4K4_MELAZ|nr:protein ACCELERATED CELL DEATH 6 [Melia azedarach]
MDPAHFQVAVRGDVNEFPFCDVDKPGISTIFNKLSPLGNSMLHVAASYNHNEIVELMAGYFPGLISKTNNQEDTALHVAARTGNLQTVATLVYCARQIPTITSEAEPSLLRMKNSKGNTALHDALLSLLASRDIDGTTSDKSLDLAALTLHLASQEPEVLYYQNKEGKSPLCLAVEFGREDILDYLLTVTAEVHGSDDRMPEGESPAHVAVKQKRLDLLKIIIQKKPELQRLRDEKGNTPLHCASSVGFIEGVRYLLEVNNDSVLERNEKGLYPLHVACKSGQVEISKKLLTKWPDPTELLCNRGRNILHVAAKSGKQHLVSCIMEESISDKLINQMDNDGNTPLHLAVLRGHYYVVEILLRDNRLISTFKNNEGLTAYDIAAKQSEILGTEFSENQIIPGKENIADHESSKAAGYTQKQPAKANSKKSKTPHTFEAIMTLSVLACRSRRSLMNHCVSVEKRRLKRESGRNEDVKKRINNLLVVATVIVGAAFAASIQMASAGGNVKAAKIALRWFHIVDSVAMHTSIVAAILLCWAQLVAANIASSIVHLVFGLLGISLYMMCLAFTIATGMAMRSSGTYSQMIFVIQLTFTSVQSFVLIPFLFVPCKLKEASILLVYYVRFRCDFHLRLRIAFFSRKQKQ